MNKTLLFLLFFCGMLSSITAQNSLRLTTTKSKFKAGNAITLEFTSSSDKNYQLYCSSSYGETVLSPSKKDSVLSFKIPEFITKKTGTLYWKIIGGNSSLSGTLTLLANQAPTALETYIGPPSIEAGGKDYAMLVVIPTDSLDNPIQNKSNVTVKQQFSNSESREEIQTNDLIAYKNIYSSLKTGRIILSTESYGLNSKEYDVNVLPAIGRNFQIFYKRHHGYADGNQITTFYTSKIKDKNNNVVSDGTFVDFYITNQDGNILKTAGNTINGVATASIIHPDCEASWKVKGFIKGIAESNSIRINFKKVVEDFICTFSKDNRTITVGPIQSFMKQMIPDGLQVKLSIYQNNKLLEEVIEQTKDGFVIFEINPNLYKKGDYSINIKAACIQKNYKSITLW